MELMFSTTNRKGNVETSFLRVIVDLGRNVHGDDQKSRNAGQITGRCPWTVLFA
jgi:hypothetical protein